MEQETPIEDTRRSVPCYNCTLDACLACYTGGCYNSTEARCQKCLDDEKKCCVAICGPTAPPIALELLDVLEYDGEDDSVCLIPREQI